MRKIADVPLPGNATRLDYQSLDARRHLLFVAHLGDGEVTVVDTRHRRAIAAVPDISEVHGVLAVPELNTVYASATGTNEVVAIDERTLRIRARIPGGVYPDGMAYDPVHRQLFVSDEEGGTETVIDTKTNRRTDTIALGGEVGNTQYDPVSKHVFVNVQTTGQLLEIDPGNHRILHRIGVRGCAGNHGLLIDATRRRAFIACEDNATFVWLDMREMRVVKTWSIGAQPDVLALDPSTRVLYVAAESGVVSMFSNGASVVRLAQGFLAPAAHTVAVDPVAHLVYFPLQNINGAPVLRIFASNIRR
jgi:DNA-binding beta-propeller fold protein YncE